MKFGATAGVLPRHLEVDDGLDAVPDYSRSQQSIIEREADLTC